MNYFRPSEKLCRMRVGLSFDENGHARREYRTLLNKEFNEWLDKTDDLPAIIRALVEWSEVYEDAECRKDDLYNSTNENALRHMHTLLREAKLL